MRTNLIEATETLIISAHEISPSKPVTFLGEVVMDAGFWAVWFLFKDRPYDVGRFYRPDGTWTGFYCDVLEPVRWQGSDPKTLEPIVDLFLDLWIAPDGRYLILDEDEFEEAIAQSRITQEQAAHARRVLEELVESTRQGDFPPRVVTEFAFRSR